MDEGDEADGSARGQSGAVQGASPPDWRNRVCRTRGWGASVEVVCHVQCSHALTVVKNYKVILISRTHTYVATILARLRRFGLRRSSSV